MSSHRYAPAICVLRSRLTLAECGITVECHHHEVASGGQCEIDFRFSNLLKRPTTFNVQVFVRNTAYQYGKPPFHAQATLRRQRFGHALSPVPMKGISLCSRV